MPIQGIYGPEDFGNPVHGRVTGQARSRITAEERARALPMPSLEWTPDVERATAHLYEKVKAVIPPVEWPLQWVHYYNDALLVDVTTGEVVDVIPNFFF